MVFKKCTRCFKEKDLNSYYNKKEGKYGKDSVCIQCNIEKHAINKITKSYQFDYTSKICKVCCKEKDVEDFYKIAGGKYGRFGTCIQCTSSIRHLKRQTAEYKVLAKNDTLNTITKIGTMFSVRQDCIESRTKISTKSGFQIGKRIIQNVLKRKGVSGGILIEVY